MSMIYGKKPIGTVAYLGGVWALPELFTWSWGQMVQWNTEYAVQPNEYVHYDRATVSYHAFARNSLVERMKGDWLLMLDSDHQFEPDILGRLLYTMNLHKVDVVCGIYHYKAPPYSPVLYRWNGKKEDSKDGGYEPLGKWDPEANLFEVGSAGAGCLLVKKSVFQRMKEELNEAPFDVAHPYSEDHSFFRRLAKLNIKAYCNPKIECKHLMAKPVCWEDYEPNIKDLTLSAKFEVGGFK